MIEFLNNIVNKQENLTDLLKLFVNISNSKGCSIFLIQESEIKYKCLKHLCIVNQNNINVKYEPCKPLDDVFISNNPNNLGGYISECEIKNIMIIPVVNPSKIGAIVLLNSDTDYNETLLDKLTPYISLIQIILQKEKILYDFKKLETFNLTGESRDLFLANISHEIRTPLNGIIGYSQLLSQTSLSTTQKNYVMSMNQCGIQLMKIINDILDFSKLSYGKMIINQDCFDIKELLEIVKDTIKNKILEKRQVLTINIDSNVPENIICDKQKLLQILINLVSNANKFTDIMGSIIINVKYLNTKELEFSVKDNGIGISEEDQCKLFNSFIQVNNAKIKNGTGLGLYITKKLVELLGGNITVQSYPLHGSKFTFNIKYKPYIDFEKTIKYNDIILKDKYILIVDDNPDNRILLSEILFEWEMKPIVCASALEAIRMVLCNRYNFVIGLIDICMPGISGIDLAKQIKEEHPFFPMIALSSIDTFVTSPEFECKLDKPINKLRLYNTILSILNKNKYPVGYLGQTNKDFSEIKQNFDIKILIAEDIIYNSNMLVNMLENLNYKNIIVAKDGKETIDILEKAYLNNDKFDILLLDLIMPYMNGYDVIEIIKKKAWNIIIIIVTASVIEEDVQKCKKLGIKYFINKPIDMKQLKELLLYSINF